MSSFSVFASQRILVRAFVAFALATVLSYGCSSDEPTRGLASACVLNSDCNAPLVCTFQRCHVVCKASVDCPSGARCIASEAGGVCQLSQEVDCRTSGVC